MTYRYQTGWFRRCVSVLLAFVMLFGLMPEFTLPARGAENGLEGKTISILGASISTYTGISNNADYNSTIGSNAVYYTEGRYGVYADDTWWMQAADDLGLRLLVNNSWSGSSLLHERSGTVGAYVDRCVQLHNNDGETPDIIGIQMGTNDFQYYKDTLGTADIDYAALITDNGDGTYTYATPVTSLEAAAIVLHKISVRYPNAEVYYLNISQRVDGTDELIQSFNAELKQVVEHFGAHIVDIYGSAITMEDFDTYIGDGRVHPNKLGMDAYTEAFKRALIENTAYSVETHTVSFDVTDAAADYGTDKLVVAGDSFSCTLTPADGLDLNVTVTMGGEDITAIAYADGTVTIDAVTADVTVTAKGTAHAPQNYRWEFDGADLACVEGDNALTKNAGTTTDGVFSKTRYALTDSVVLLHDQPWVVEWKCEGTFLNTNGSSGARIFTSDDVNANYNARYIFKSNTNGIIAMGEKTTSGSHNYGIALADHGIDWTALHTYRLENRIAADGSNMVYLYVDGEEIGPMNHYYVGTTDKNTTSDWLSGKDFVFPYMGTDTHGFTNASIEYIAVWEGGAPDKNGNLIDVASPTSANDSVWSYAYGVWTMTNSNYVNLRYDVEIEAGMEVCFSFDAKITGGSAVATIRTENNTFLVTQPIRQDGTVTLSYTVTETAIYRFQISGVSETSCGEFSNISVIQKPEENFSAYTAESKAVIAEVTQLNPDLSVLLFADNHSYDENKYLKYPDIMSHGVLDYQVGLGDYVDYSHADKETARKNLITSVANAGTSPNCFYVYGNHDVGICGVNAGTDSLDVVMTPEENYEVFGRHLESGSGMVVDAQNPHGGYYYVDDTTAKIRMIVLNTSDIFNDNSDTVSYVRYQQQLRVSQTQLTWFAEKALSFADKENPGEWSVIVFAHAYNPYGSNMLLFDILNAVQNGTSINKSITVYTRLTKAADGSYTSTVDKVNGDTYSVNADYSEQGPVSVLGYIHGHDHVDNNSVISGINRIQVRCDNGHIDQYYIAPFTNDLQGSYYFRDESGHIYSFTCNTKITGVGSIGYNFYWTNAKMASAPIAVFDENGIRIKSVSCQYVEAVPEGATEITGFVSERDGRVVGEESCQVLCIDKEAGTLTFIPYGTGTRRVITYDSFAGNEVTPEPLSLRYDDHYDVTGKVVEIVDAGTPTSYKVGYGVAEGTLDDAVVTLDGDTLIATGIGTAEVRIDGQLYEVTVTAAPISLLLLAGQSNMQGSEGDADQSIVCPEGMVYATYGDRYTMTVSNATNYAPSALTGEGSALNVNGTTANLEDWPVYLLNEAGAGKAGPDSGFAYEWVQQTGEKVWIVNAAHGGSSITTWQASGANYKEAVALFSACQETLRQEIAAGHYTLSHMGYFWCQGCKDYGQTAEWYVEKYLAMHENFKTELAFDHDSDSATEDVVFEFGGIIPVRAGHEYYTSYRQGEYADTTTAKYHESFKDLRFTGPRVAQYWMTNNPDLPDIWNVCNIGESWVWMPDGTNGVSEYFQAHYENGTVDYQPQVEQKESWYTPTTPAAVHDSIHYNQIGYNEVGRESARNALILLGEMVAPDVETTVKFLSWDGYTEVDEITASTAGNSGTLVVPKIYPVWKSKEVTYELSEGLSYDYYDLLAADTQTAGNLTAGGKTVTVVKAEPNAHFADHLSELPEELCCGVNLWDVLEHDQYYYTNGTGWGIHSSGTVCSVTIPVNAGDLIYASSFGAAGNNGHSSTSGIRVTFFDAHGVVKTMAPSEVYPTFTENGGYLIAPEGTVAVNIPMWTDSDEWELYILNLPHDESSDICSICGKDSHTHEWSEWETVTTPSIDGPGEEKRTCACGEAETRQVDGVWQTLKLSDHMSPMPEEYCAGTNLWTALAHDKYFFNGTTSWTIHSSGTVYSVTIPVSAGDKIFATSFGASGENGGSKNGIRVTFFDAEGVVKTTDPAGTYAEFTANGGYLIAPEGAVAVNIPMWTNDDSNEIYILSRAHSYSGVSCTICGAEHPEATGYEGKVISILSASTSTFAGYIPVADGFNLEHRARYPQDNLLTDVNDTWWMQVINELDAKLGINDSWAGSTVYWGDNMTTQNSDTGEKAAMASLTRIQNLGSNGTPDVIFFFGGGNDMGKGVTLGTFDPATAPAQVDLTATEWDTFADAYVAAIMRMQYYYPDAQIVAMVTYAMPYYVTAEKLDALAPVIEAICDHYGVYCVDLRDSGVTFDMLPDNVHPNAEGMDYITADVLDTLLNRVGVNAGENVVCPVTHDLTNAGASLHYYKGVSAGKPFTETISGEAVTVTVTMGGVDITSQVYANDTITIPNVTGALVITAKGTFDADGHLQQLPENICAGTNLWTALEPENIYYTATGWGNTSVGTTWSITFPVEAGDRIWATSLGHVSTNGSSANGVRVTWFDENGVLQTVSRDVVYAEFAEYGYITAPVGAVALNLPMTNNDDGYAVYILNREHSYSGTACTICGAEHPEATGYEGKVISILGDSISTFAGYIPTADGFNLEHYARYPQDNLLTDVNETWWMQVLTELDAKLGINDSWRSTEVYNYIDEEVNSSYDGTKACMASLTRIQNLGSNGTPDVILFYGGTNDITQRRPVGSFDPANAPTEVDLTSVKWDTVADAYVAAIMRMQYYYPEAEIIAMLPTFTYKNTDTVIEEYNSVFAAICEHYGVTYVDLRDCGISTSDLPDGTHPNATGMDYITEAVVDALLNECEMEAGENVVYSVTHELENAEASLGYYKGVSAGRSFVETISGDDVAVTVTMGGVDITATAYSEGVVSISAVSGDLVITAKGEAKPIHADYLQQLPEEICAGTNLWTVLEHNKEYYTVNGWGVHSSGKVYSVTIPITPGDQLWATSFQASGTNGGTGNGIRITWFGEYDVLRSMSPSETYAEFSANGYLTAPEGAVAVNVVMWNGDESNEFYILNREHSYGDWETVTEPTPSQTGLRQRTCSICGDTEQEEIPKLDVLYGDVNSDGKVNSLDAILLRQYIAGWDVEPDLNAADVTGDGKVNSLDMILLRQYIAGWNVTLGPTE